jgi:hypothetical protein
MKGTCDSYLSIYLPTDRPVDHVAALPTLSMSPFLPLSLYLSHLFHVTPLPSLSLSHLQSELTPPAPSSVEEDEIDRQCDSLRAELLAAQQQSASRDSNNSGGGGPGPRRGLKMHQVHELADAKIRQDDRFRSALKISRDYEEGGHWKRQEDRLRRAAEREHEDERQRESEREREREEGDGRR